MEEILAALASTRPDLPAPTQDTRDRLAELISFCPVYRDLLRRRPELVPWLEEPDTARRLQRAADYAVMHRHPLHAPAGADAAERIASLRRFRRAMTMRIAYRDLSDMSEIVRSMRELTALAEYVLAEALDIALKRCQDRMGMPWDEEGGCPARFSILGLGKLGAGELNFVSDLDLIYVYDGHGHCRKGGVDTMLSNEQFYARMAQDLTAMLQERTQHGFLYNIDLRLRPEGEGSPIVRSLTGIEKYYYGAGQTWERLALMKARPVAGDRNLGGETMETINAFRFPHSVPPSLFEEVAGLKLRIEREVLGEENFRLDIKNGWGGIREIEFIVQALQCFNQTKIPFLQTASTLDAMACLERYGILTTDQVNFLCESYVWLRRVEHRLQMRDEEQTQTLPHEGSPAREALARSLGMEPQNFERRMEEVRASVRKMYESFFSLTSSEKLYQEWTEFISGGPPGPQIDAMLSKVFWGPRGPIEQGLRRLALGRSMGHMVTRETVQLMIELAGAFPEALAPQAHPLRTLGRVNDFADRYGARKSFLRMCAHNKPFFLALCMLFDRSSFIQSLVCAHPEILEELMMTGTLRLNKTGRVMRREIRMLEKPDDDETAKALWLWIKAEQVRIAMAQVLSMVGLQRVEFALSRLASVAVDEMLRRVDPEGDLIAVAMGKFGAREMSFGSDLDMMLVCVGASDEVMTRKALRLRRLLGHKGPLGAGFEVDMRLRPHGEDGPLVVSLPALEHYHNGHGGMLWERQALLRSRPLSDRSEVRQKREAGGELFMEARRRILFGQPPPPDLFAQIASMRRRIEVEKVKAVPPQRCFKAGPGGILDVEFIVQALQLRHGGEVAGLDSQNTREAAHVLHQAGLLTSRQHSRLMDNYEFLRRVEFRLRREHNSPVNEIADDFDLGHSISHWMSFPDIAALLEELGRRMAENRTMFETLVAPLK